MPPGQKPGRTPHTIVRSSPLYKVEPRARAFRNGPNSGNNNNELMIQGQSNDIIEEAYISV